MEDTILIKDLYNGIIETCLFDTAAAIDKDNPAPPESFNPFCQVIQRSLKKKNLCRHPDHKII